MSSPTDPLGDLPVLDIVAGGYGILDNTMLPGRVVRKVRNPYAFARKAMFKFDGYSLIDFDAMPSHSFRVRRHLRNAIRRY